ncbi:restriction endonuclease subunit S [uncultured Brachyspira sp.]|uniref:restriction endonuclease subunit S n=1 Tax=uncultured Brachyspira sp. TaxID=221953 RepID=UPI0025DF5946|nr:restriction endonuclease subunit S [uncultured Brachyspira sp.]
MYKGAITMNHPLPRGWQEKKISDISEVTSSKRIYEKEYVKNGIPFYRGKEITLLKNKEKIKELFYISEERYIELKNNYGVPKKNDILITAVGTIGNAYMIDDDKPFYFKDGNLIWLKNIKEYPKFLEFLFEYNQNKILEISMGSSQKALTIIKLENLSFYFPPLDEQKRIAEVLSLCDKLIENLTKLIEKKEIYKKGVMQRVLTGKVRFNGFKDEWREINLRDIVEEYSIPNTNKLKQYTIGKNGIKELDDFRHSIDKHKVFKKNDLIVGIGIDEINVNINLDYGCCSPVYRVYSINTNLLNPKFGYFYIRKAIDRIKNKITRKSTRREFEFDHKEFIKYSILLPSLEEQNKIAELLTLIDKDIEILKQLLHLRKLQKKGVMQKLLTGEVRI